MWVIRIADSVLLTCCPPAPLALYVSIFKSESLISISTSSASGKTAIVAAEVCTRPLVSVFGTLCTLCTPLSYLSIPKAPLPCIETMASLIPPIPVSEESITLYFQFFLSAYLVYTRNKSAANNAASSPPVPALISKIKFLSSLGSRGSKRIFKSLSSLSLRDSSSINSS